MTRVWRWLLGSSTWTWNDQSCDRIEIILPIGFLVFVALCYAVPALRKVIKDHIKRRRVHGNNPIHIYGRRVR
jgi:heme/copper-type cytochrome/quinol oxidase subunit 2